MSELSESTWVPLYDTGIGATATFSAIQGSITALQIIRSVTLNYEKPWYTDPERTQAEENLKNDPTAFFQNYTCGNVDFPDIVWEKGFCLRLLNQQLQVCDSDMNRIQDLAEGEYFVLCIAGEYEVTRKEYDFDK